MSGQGRGWRLGSAATCAVLALSAAGCSPATTETSSAPTLASQPATASSPAASSGTACVADPAAVVARQPTPESTTAALPADLTAQLDAAARAGLEKSDAPGVLVGVRTPDGTWTAAHGYSDVDRTAPMTPDMHLRIGSLTKTFTTTVLLRAEQDGALSLSDMIGKYVPGMPNGDVATLENLATMTSGIPTYTASKAFLDDYFTHPTKAHTPEELISFVRAEDPMFAPGEEFFYSNTNTVLLGLALQDATKTAFPTLLTDDVLTPLALSGTSFPTDSAIPEPHPRGYTLQGNADGDLTPTDATDWSPTFGWTAGQMISTLPDMLTWDRALATGQGVLSEATALRRLESIPAPPRVAYGIGMGCIDGWVGHTGELPGFNTSVFHNTDADISVVVMTNSDIASGACTKSPTLHDSDLPCMAPATRVFVELASALGHPFTPNPMS